MQDRTTMKSQRSLADLRLGAVTSAQLDELATHYDRTLDQAAAMAVHIAYLALLDEKREEALQALDMGPNCQFPDDELPF